MRIKVGNLVEVMIYNPTPNVKDSTSDYVLGLVTEVTNPQYGIPPVYWIKFVEDGEELRVQHSDIVRVIR